MTLTVEEAVLALRNEFEIDYARQVLHHARDLDALVSECAAPGGMFAGVSALVRRSIGRPISGSMYSPAGITQ